MRVPRDWWLAALASTAPLGCSSLPAEAQPAVILEPTIESRAELTRIVAAAAGRPTLLAADALTRESSLVLEQREPASPAGRQATGRTLDAPLRLELVLRGERCLLVRATDGREWPLTAARCVPAASLAIR